MVNNYFEKLRIKFLFLVCFICNKICCPEFCKLDRITMSDSYFLCIRKIMLNQFKNALT